MKIAIALVNDIDISVLKNRLNTELVYSSQFQGTELKRADIAVQIDEDIFVNNKQIDLVVEIHSVDADIEKFADSQCLLIKDKLIVFDAEDTADNNFSFACGPEIYSLLGSQYKFNIDSLFHNYVKENYYPTYKNKTRILATRLGIEFYVI